MEKILAAMTLEKSSIIAGQHALNLAKRINAPVTFLLIERQNDQNKCHKKEVEEMIYQLLNQNNSCCPPADFYSCVGDYTKQLIKFVSQLKTTIVVLAAPSETRVSKNIYKDFMEKLHHRLNCKIEVVQRKNNYKD